MDDTTKCTVCGNSPCTCQPAAPATPETPAAPTTPETPAQ